MIAWMRRHAKAGCLVAVLLVATFIGLPLALMKHMDIAPLQAVLQVLSGSWDPASNRVIGFNRALATVAAVVLNTGVLTFGIGLLVWLARRERRQQMQLTDAYLIKETAIKQALFARLNAESDAAMLTAIQECFDEGENNWESLLAAWVGEDDAKRLIAQIKELEVNSARRGVRD